MKVKTIQSQTGVLEEYQFFFPNIIRCPRGVYTYSTLFIIVLQLYTLTYIRATGVLG